MDAVLRGREKISSEQSVSLTPASALNAEQIFSHMSAYMENATV
jgi:hypothetical protein